MSGIPVARAGDFHTCPLYDGKTPHVGGPIISGSPNVQIGGIPVATVGDQAVCVGGGVDTIVQGSSTVRVNGKPAALMGSLTAHGGVVVVGASNVVVGDTFVPASVLSITSSKPTSNASTAHVLASSSLKSPSTTGLSAESIVEASKLKKGSQGSTVKALQAELNKAGYNLKEDGIWGEKTERAYQDYLVAQASPTNENPSIPVSTAQAPQNTETSNASSADSSTSDSNVSEDESPAEVWMKVARDELGTKEIAGATHNPRVLEYHATTSQNLKSDDNDAPWCSSFINWVMTNSGYTGTNSARSQAWKNWGQALKEPAYGAVAVVSYGGGLGHVGFVAGKSANGKIVLLGGNQSDQVNYTPFSKSMISAYVYPQGVTPHKDDYNLRIIDAKTENGTLTNTR